MAEGGRMGHLVTLIPKLAKNFPLGRVLPHTPTPRPPFTVDEARCHYRLNSTQSLGHVMIEGLTPTHRNAGMTDNVINMSEWLKQKRLSKLKQMWFWYPIRDENEPLGYRFELVEAIPLGSIVSNGVAH